jgi:tight adherence protein C
VTVAAFALGATASGLVISASNRMARPAGRPLPHGRAIRGSLGPLERIGRRVLRVGRVRQPDPGAARQAGLVTVAAFATLPVFPPLSVVIAAGAVVRARMRRIRQQRNLVRAVADGLPEAVDLLLLCSGAGIALPLAHPLVGRHLPPPIGPALLAADAASAAGLPRADGLLRELGRLGDRAATLAHLLADHLRYGVPLAPALERLGLELRLDRRRRAEQDARRVPIRLLGPLVTCVLPAFGLLTVVPLLVASLRSLPT